MKKKILVKVIRDVFESFVTGSHKGPPIPWEVSKEDLKKIYPDNPYARKEVKPMGPQAQSGSKRTAD